MPSTHLREQFLSRLSATTLANLTTTSTRVEVGLATPLPKDAQPTLLIDLGEEAVEPGEMLRGRQRRTLRQLEVLVRGAVKASSGYLTTLNAIAYDVEIAIAGDQSLGGLCQQVQLAGIGEPVIEGQGEKTVAVMSMRFIVHYAAAIATPGTPS